jgi:hypothetical protein
MRRGYSSGKKKSDFYNTVAGHVKASESGRAPGKNQLAGEELVPSSP